MRNNTNDGVIHFDEPKVLNFYEFAYKHLNCDSIAVAATVDTPLAMQIVAYASSKEYNSTLLDLFLKKYQNGKYVIMRHISDKEVDAI